MEESLPFPLQILWIMCVLHFLCWVQHKINLLIDQNWLREMLLKKLFHIWWDFVTSLVKTIKSTFFNNKQKISTASVKKKKKETIALWYSLIIILYLLSCTLRYLLPRSVLICQMFYHTQLACFATPRKQWGWKFIKSFQKDQVDVDPLLSQQERNFENFVRILHNHLTDPPPRP